jgi:hypothetical protein
MMPTYYKYKQEIDNMSMDEFVVSLRKAKLYAALDEIMAGKKYGEAKKQTALQPSDLKLLDINRGLSYVINPNKKYTKRKPTAASLERKYNYENFVTDDEPRPRRKIKAGEINVNDITIDSVKNSIK